MPISFKISGDARNIIYKIYHLHLTNKQVNVEVLEISEHRTVSLSQLMYIVKYIESVKIIELLVLLLHFVLAKVILFRNLLKKVNASHD